MHRDRKIEKSINLLLDICSLMMKSGANTKRVINSVSRFAQALHFEFHALISHKSIIMTLKDINTSERFTVVTQIPSYKIDFTLVADISRASWKSIDENWSFNQIHKRIIAIKAKNRYPLWLELLTVSLAGAGFTKLFGGDYLNMMLAFIATLVGLVVLKVSSHIVINTYVKVYIAASVASLIAVLGILFQFGSQPQITLATSVLFLVPGVPLINSFNDLYNNHILNGMVRFISGFMIVLAIGLGLITMMLFFNINNFK